MLNSHLSQKFSVFLFNITQNALIELIRVNSSAVPRLRVKIILQLGGEETSSVPRIDLIFGIIDLLAGTIR